MQNARFGWFALVVSVVLGGTAVVAPATTPFALPAAAAAEITPPEVRALEHTVQPGDSLARLAATYRREAGWYSQVDLLAAIRQANGLESSNLLRPGQRLAIPMHVERPHPRAARPTHDGAAMRGLYLPAAACASASVLARVDSFIVAGGNGVVFDVKDIDGGLSFRSAVPLAAANRGRAAPAIADLRELVTRLHARDLWVVARIAIFLDGELGRLRPDLALRGADGEPWTERGCTWLDPAHPEVRAYHRDLALELAHAGVDEVQLDYVRFPTNGWRGDWQGDLAATAARRREVITSFVASVHDTLRAVGCVLSADLFGIMAWDRTEDLALTGQHVPSLAAHLDVICPMIYPSHFAPGFEGIARPGDEPALLIEAGVRRFQEQAGPGTPVRPWLQAFPWRVSRYDGNYVLVQVAAAEQAGAAGWCLWNPSGRYHVAQAALRAGLPTLVAVAEP